MNTSMGISVIIPARNAASTIEAAIASLQAQTYSEWEAIIVDDGSTDRTRPVCAALAGADTRIRVIENPGRGVSAARNAGIAAARNEWLHFLDADDLILPTLYARLVSALAGGEFDAAYCGWRRIGPDGQAFDEHPGIAYPNLFEEFAAYCAFSIHACLTRRSLVVALGGFDTQLRTCEDWDLWQRAARTGARFTSIPDILALYRTHLESASANMPQLLSDGLQVIARGHARDPRVDNPAPAFAEGAPAERKIWQQYSLACWCAGWMLGAGETGIDLLRPLASVRCPEPDPELLASAILHSMVLPTCRRPSEAFQLWPDVEERLAAFLLALERQLRAPGLAGISQSTIEALVLDQAEGSLPLRAGKTFLAPVDVTAPIPDLALPRGVERLRCRVQEGEESIGAVELPVFDGVVPADVLRDAIAARFGWSLLGRFLRRTVYPALDVRPEAEGFSVWRGQVQIAEHLRAADANAALDLLHERAGWTVFMQELWDRPDWPQGHFYNPELAEAPAVLAVADEDWIKVEVSAPLPDVQFAGPELYVLVRAGGSPLGVARIKAENRVVRAQELRAAITEQAGMELARVVAREALVGLPGADSLRARAAAAARVAPDGAPLQPGFISLSPHQATVVLGRRASDRIDSLFSRRAALPLAARDELELAARLAGEPVLEWPAERNGKGPLLYAPDAIARSLAPWIAPCSMPARVPDPPARQARTEWETLFKPRADSPNQPGGYEQKKYEQMLSLLPPGPIARALILGCAEAYMTAQLAPRVGSLLARDVPLGGAARWDGPGENASSKDVDLARDPLPGDMDLIVCNEILYYLASRDALARAGHKLVDALAPRGYLLLAHANMVVDDPEHTGFDWNFPFGARVIGETLSCIPGLSLVRELRTPLYRLQLFRRRAGQTAAAPSSPLLQKSPVVVEVTEHEAPGPQAAAHILWGGGPGSIHQPAPFVTERLPILMYHRVAPDGSAALARYRVSPEAFEEQLAYLRDAGYYSVSLEDWGRAAAARRPLPGRAVLLTFDDGYLDFLVCAWPLLQRYGLKATVFLVADQVGRTNAWDREFGEEIPLLDWPQIKRMQSEGVEFGAHSATHARLDALSPRDVVSEAARSRAMLLERLGAPVRAFAYPYGGQDEIVQHVVAACGYEFGLTTVSRRSGLGDPLLALPRIEVSGADHLQDFIDKLGE